MDTTLHARQAVFEMELDGVVQVAAVFGGKLAVDEGVIFRQVDRLAQGGLAVSRGDDLVEQFALGEIQGDGVELDQGHVFEVEAVLAKFDGGHLAEAEVGNTFSP